MGFLSNLVGQATVLAEKLASGARDTVREHVRMEDPRTLFLSDWALTTAVATLGRVAVPDAELRAEQLGPGYRVTARVGGKAVSALLVFEAVRFEQGHLTLDVGTPEGIELEARPVANFFAAAIARLFGGMWLGGKIFSLVTPDDLTWDGAKATYQVALEKIPIAGMQLALIEAEARVRRGQVGLLVEFADENAATQLHTVLSGAVWELAGSLLAARG
jgi:hypothetical protein